MAKLSFACCLSILLYISILGEIKGASEPTAAVTPQRHVTCVYTYGCVADEAACTEACRKFYRDFNQGCTFTLRTCACACFCMTHREKIEDCHYPPPPANVFKFDTNNLGPGHF